MITNYNASIVKTGADSMITNYNASFIKKLVPIQ
jgi:hypothetical protein